MPRFEIRFRVVLPIVFGFLAAALMAWNYQNDRMVELMGMGWDTGPPFWPYQSTYLLLSAINAPAFVLSMPILKLLNLHTLSLQYAVWFPSIVGWWWWVGTRIDFGVLGRRRYRHTRLVAGAFIAAALGLLYAGTRASLGELHWWLEYGRSSVSIYALPLMRTVVPVLWCFVLAGGFLIAGVRLFQGRVPPAEEKRRKYRLLTIGTALVALYILAVHGWDKTLIPSFDYNECAFDRLYRLGCIHGTMIDGSGKALGRIEVELAPANKTKNARRAGMRLLQTDEQGRYNFNGIEPGEYFLAVHVYLAPDKDRPFATAYYPGVEAESAAERVPVKSSSRTNLKPLQLRKVEFVTIKIRVLWPNGTSPDESDVCFENVRNTDQEWTCPQIDRGEGEAILPKDTEYDAVAWVQCKAGENINSRQSKPVQRIEVADGTTPTELTFVVQGPPCTLLAKH